MSTPRNFAGCEPEPDVEYPPRPKRARQGPQRAGEGGVRLSGGDRVHPTASYAGLGRAKLAATRQATAATSSTIAWVGWL